MNGRPDDTRTRAEAAFQRWLDRFRSGEAVEVERFLEEEPIEIRAELGRMIQDYQALRGRIGEGAPKLEPGRVLGDFRLVREVGRGGMAVVWEAEQISLRRAVALKLLLPHYTLSPKTLERFEREARAGGRLAHAGIVQTYAVGRTDGLHWISQELVAGGYTLADSLADLREARELPEGYYRGVAEFFAKVAEALEYAHRQGVIHRDVKPSNILITEGDEPKLADFGLARIQDDLALSRTGELEGTPHYMSPEQAAAKSMGIDHRTDVFSLGSTLYEALTLVRAFDGDTSQLVFRKILTVDPPNPRTIRSKVPRDLAVICMKALEKDPERRFPTIAAFGAELQRFTCNEPIHTRPSGRIDRIRKWTRRHPVISTSAAVAALSWAIIALLLWRVSAERDEKASALVAQSAALKEAEDARREADLEKERVLASERQTRRQANLANLRAARAFLDEGDVTAGQERLEDVSIETREFEWKHQKIRADNSLAQWKSDPARSLAFSPDGRRIVWGGDSEILHLAEVSSLETRSLSIDHGGIQCLEFESDGNRLACGNADGSLVLFDLESEQPVAKMQHPATVVCAAFLPGTGKLLAGLANGEIWTWDATNQSLVNEFSAHRDVVSGIFGLPDGSRFVSSSIDGNICVWNLDTHEQLATLTRRAFDPKWIIPAISHDGHRMAFGSKYREVSIVDVDTNKLVSAVTGPKGNVTAIKFTPDGKCIAFGSSYATATTVTTWDCEARQRIGLHRGHTDFVSRLASSPDGQLLASASWDGTTRLWSLHAAEGFVALDPQQEMLLSVACSPDGTRLYAGSNSGSIVEIDAVTGDCTARFRGHLSSVLDLAVDSSGQEVVSASADRTLRAWDAETRSCTAVMKGHEGAVGAVAVLPDGKRCVSGSNDKTIRVWDLTTGQELARFVGHEEQVVSVAIRADGRRLASGSRDRTVRLWDLETEEELAVLRGHDAAVDTVVWMPDGRRIASSGWDHTIRVWDVASGTELLAIRGAQPKIASSADGTRILSGGQDESVRVWDSETGEELTVLQGPEIIEAIVMTPDGERVVAVGQYGKVVIWHSDPTAFRRMAWAAVRRDRVRPRVDNLFDRLEILSEVVDALAKDASLGEDVRESAMRMARYRGDSPEADRLNPEDAEVQGLPGMLRYEREAIMDERMLAVLASRVPVGMRAHLEDLHNPGFEEEDLSGGPRDWQLPVVCAQGGYRLAMDREVPFEGSACARLEYGGEGEPQTFGNLMQSLDGASWRDRPIRLRAQVRLESDDPDARAQMWLRVDRSNGATGLFDNMDVRPVRSSKWTACEIEGIIEHDAERLNFGVMLLGRGKLWVDAVELVAGEALLPAPPEPARPLDERGLANLTAFARLFGYVRHFYPGDEVESVKWDDLAVAGARAVEGERGSAELVRVLQAMFAPIAPGVRVFAAGGEPEPALVLDRPADSERLYVRWWRHSGFGQEQSGPYQIYQSIWRKDRVRSEELPQDVPDPGKPWRAELGGGVECIIPLALWADREGTLPRAPEAAAAIGDRFGLPANHRASGDDRATRLAAVIMAWNVFQHFYPYFDVVDADWPAELERALRRAATDDGERAFLNTLRRMVAALKDGHGGVRHPSDAAYAVLPLAWDWVEEELVVTHVGEVARAAGVTPGDAVVAIDGKAVAELRAEAEALISGATSQWVANKTLYELMRGNQASRRLTLEAFARADERYEVELPLGAAIDTTSDRPSKIEEVWPGIWYVDLDRVSDEDFNTALPQLTSAEGIVFDLRGYPSNIGPETFFSHLIEEPATSAQWHTPLITLPNREWMTFNRSGEWSLKPREPLLPPRRAFLTGGGAISYAESCMGIVEHYRLGEIVGGPTAGTNGNVNPFEVPGGYTITWTGMKVLKHDGSRHHGVGIAPTIPVERTRAGVAEGRDEVLERAVEAVRAE